MTKEEVIRIAQQIAEDEQWPWQEPVSASLVEEKQGGFFAKKKASRVWWIVTNTAMRGMNVNLRIDNDAGQVIFKAFAKY